MPQSFLQLQGVSFRYERATEPILADVSAFFPPGWTGVVGANGVGKSTLLQLCCGLLSPQSGLIRSSGDCCYCPQRTDHCPTDLAALLADYNREAILICSQLRLEDDWPDRWPSLSHGERKRAQIAVALWQDPAVLALDEPSNHIDSDAREMLMTALRAFRGVGLLVSHDRDMVDTLCSQCLFIDPPNVAMRPGGVTQGLQQSGIEQQDARRNDDHAKHELQRLKREQQRRRELSEQSAKKGSRSSVAAKDHDAKDKIARAKVSDKDSAQNKGLRQMSGRLRQAEERRQSSGVKKVYEMGIWLENGGCSQRAALLRLEPGHIGIASDRILAFPELSIAPQDRIALTGPNGSGKSSFIRHVLPLLKVEPEHLVVVPQEISAEACRDIIREVAALPKEPLGQLMTIVSRLGSRPQRLLESSEPSPGEIRKILLALGICKTPHLIIMDEPTNHMDLPSIQCLEEALAECPCALLLVSHDRRFLDAVTTRHWHIARTPQGGAITPQ